MGDISMANLPVSTPKKSLQSSIFSDDYLTRPNLGMKIRFEAKNNDWIFFADYQYSPPAPLIKNVSQTDHLDLKTQITMLGASYRLFSFHNTSLEVLAGTRYHDNEMSTKTTERQQLKHDTDTEWWHGTYAGLRLFQGISENLTFVGRSNIEIGSGDNDIYWDVTALLDYQFDSWSSFYLGYKFKSSRSQEYDSSEDNLNYHTLEQGPFIGLTFRW